MTGRGPPCTFNGAFRLMKKMGLRFVGIPSPNHRPRLELAGACWNIPELAQGGKHFSRGRCGYLRSRGRYNPFTPHIPSIQYMVKITYMDGLNFMVNVGKYTIHGCYGYMLFPNMCLAIVWAR